VVIEQVRFSYTLTKCN